MRQAWRGLMEGTITPDRFNSLTTLADRQSTETVRSALQRWICGGDCFSNGHVTRPARGYIVDLLAPATRKAFADFEFNNVVIEGAAGDGYLLDATKGQTAWPEAGRPFHEVDGGWPVIVRKQGSINKVNRRWGDWYVIGRAFLAGDDRLLIVRNDEPMRYTGGGFRGKPGPVLGSDGVPTLILTTGGAQNITEDAAGLKYVPRLWANRIHAPPLTDRQVSSEYYLDNDNDRRMDKVLVYPGVETDFRAHSNFHDFSDFLTPTGPPTIWHIHAKSPTYRCTPLGRLIGTSSGMFIFFKDIYTSTLGNLITDTAPHGNSPITCRRP